MQLTTGALAALEMTIIEAAAHVRYAVKVSTQEQFYNNSQMINNSLKEHHGN